MSDWKHDELANDLAAHLRGNTLSVVWTDMQLGPAGSPRPDVYAVEKTYTRLTARAFEVKISASDLLRDLNAGKWSSYAKYATGVVFALPDTLARSHGEHIPSACGLIVRSSAGWRYRRRGAHQPKDNLPRDAWLKLVMDGIERAALERVGRRPLSDWACERAQARAIGQETARLLSRLRSAPFEVEAEIARHEKHMEQLRQHHALEIEALRSRRSNEDSAASELVSRIARAFGCEPEDVLTRLRASGDLITSRRFARSPGLEILAGDLRRSAQALEDAAALLRGPHDGGIDASIPADGSR